MEDDGVLLPRVHCALPLLSQLHRLLSNVHPNDEEGVGDGDVHDDAALEPVPLVVLPLLQLMHDVCEVPD